MPVAGAVAALLVVSTTVIHYELLRVLSTALARLQIPPRGKLLLVIFATFFAHALEILLYALAVYLLVHAVRLGTLGAHHGSLAQCLYFSAETYTSLGYGDIVPTGDLRLVAGVEALNGLLLIGWSASYMYIAMERFWKAG